MMLATSWDADHNAGNECSIRDAASNICPPHHRLPHTSRNELFQHACKRRARKYMPATSQDATPCKKRGFITRLNDAASNVCLSLLLG